MAWSGNNPKIYGPGIHVIHDQNLRPLENRDFVSIDQSIVQHGVFRILRIAPNQLAKIWINTLPYFLVPRSQPYVFKEAIFRMDEMANFSDGYIEHGNYHILQIPKGQVANVWIGSVPFILESKEEPYLFKEQNFRIDTPKKKKADDIPPTSLFFDATQKLITNGSLKRVMPRTGEIAITYNNGKLVILEPRQDEKPTLISSPNHLVDSFLQINIQTLEFPSEKRKQMRLKENAVETANTAYRDVNYEICTTG